MDGECRHRFRYERAGPPPILNYIWQWRCLDCGYTRNGLVRDPYAPPKNRFVLMEEHDGR